MEAIKKAAGTMVPEKSFGRNQLIGLGGLLMPWLVATVFLALGRVQFAEWQGFHTGYIWPGLTVVLGLGAAAKVADAFRRQPPAQ